MRDSCAGLHHVTAICGHPQTNNAFYTDILGLRRVKKTVNFDAPETYHLYYGDDIGSPGSALTFFPVVGASPGVAGRGEPSNLSWAVMPGALDYWRQRLAAIDGLTVVDEARFDEARVTLTDPHGLSLALVEADWARPPNANRRHPALAAEHALGPFHGVSVSVAAFEPTARVLHNVFGFEAIATEGAITRFQASEGPGVGTIIDLCVVPETPLARQGAGSIHHIAFRARDKAHQQRLSQRVADLGLSPTEVIDRQYFESVYFREPGGSLFEIATDAPGFTIDEPVETLGEELKLPPQYESRRADIEAELPALD